MLVLVLVLLLLLLLATAATTATPDADAHRILIDDCAVQETLLLLATDHIRSVASKLGLLRCPICLNLIQFGHRPSLLPT